MRVRVRIAWAAVAGLALLGGYFAFTRISLSALNEPGRAETYLATRAKHMLVSRAAHRSLPPRPPDDAASAAIGNMEYGSDCASCHGTDGRTPTDVGRSMYPRAPRLDSPPVQEWSDEELFWIIKNGVRLSGMPGFGKIHSDEQIWHLVYYVRRIGAPPDKRPSR